MQCTADGGDRRPSRRSRHPRLPVRQWVLSVPKRLLRYCARPAFALQRLREIDAERLVYESVKPGAGGSVTLILSLYCLANGEAAIVGRRQCIAKPSSRLRSGSDGSGSLSDGR